MAEIISPKFLHELRASAQCQILASIGDVGAFTDGPILTSGWHFPWMATFEPMLGNVSQIKQRLQPAYGKTSLAKIKIELLDRSLWKDKLAWNYIKNKIVCVYIGPYGGEAGDFYKFFTGLVSDFSISDERLSLTVMDDLYVAKKRIPEVNDTNTQTLIYSQENPYDIITDLMETHAGVPSERINSTDIETERDLWVNGWSFNRVLTNSKHIKVLLDELQEETSSFLYTEGDQFTVKAFAPKLPGQTYRELTENQIQNVSLSLDGRMDDNLCNRCVIYYDYDESGQDNEENYESVATAENSDSQTNWGETAERIIKSKWIRSLAWDQPSNITGIVIYHISKSNRNGSGTLSYTATSEEITWTAPGGGAGAAVKIDSDGHYQVMDANENKYVRISVTYDSLPDSDQDDTITLTSQSASIFAGSLAHHYVARYSDPQAEVKFRLPIQEAVWQGDFHKPGDLVKITSECFVTRGQPEWDEEIIFLSAANMNFQKGQMTMEGLQTGFRRKYGFIGASTITNNYDTATTAEKEYAFVADSNNYLGANNDAAYFIY